MGNNSYIQPVKNTGTGIPSLLSILNSQKRFEPRVTAAPQKPTRKKVYKSLSGKVFNTAQEAALSNKIYLSAKQRFGSTNTFKPRTLNDILNTPVKRKVVTVDGGQLPEVQVTAPAVNKPVTKPIVKPRYTSEEKNIMNLTADEIKEIQKTIGTKADGIWGPKSHDAWLKHKKNAALMKQLNNNFIKEISNKKDTSLYDLSELMKDAKIQPTQVSSYLDNFNLPKINY